MNGIYGTIVYAGFLVYIFRFCIERSNRFDRNAIRVIFLYLFLFGLTLQPMEYSHFMQLFFFSLFAVLHLHGKDTAVEVPVEVVRVPLRQLERAPETIIY